MHWVQTLMKKFLIIYLLIIILLVSHGNIHRVDGEFYDTFEGTNESNITDIYYQFKSYDDSVWWALTEKEIGFIPESNTEYRLIYSDNGTTKDDKVCDCPEDYMCECYLYDDIFIKVIEKR